MITVENLTKSFHGTTAVKDLNFTVRKGVVTGFLGPNGAGKSTTMRMILGLDAPTSGRALIDGQSYVSLVNPLTKVGALLDAKWTNPARTARNHLRWMAASNGLPASRVDEVIELVGLSSVAGKKAGKFSLGMGQRLGIAGALLGDPQVLLFDEPVNGLDPDGILWIRNLMRTLASQGRTVFVSSHLLSEMAQTADHLIIIGRGQLLADVSTTDFINQNAGNEVLVRSPQLDQLAAGLAQQGVTAMAREGGAVFSGISAQRIGEAAAASGIVLHELTPRAQSLEEAYMALTGASVEYTSGNADLAAAANQALGGAQPTAPSNGEGARS